MDNRNADTDVLNDEMSSTRLWLSRWQWQNERLQDKALCQSIARAKKIRLDVIRCALHVLADHNGGFEDESNIVILVCNFHVKTVAM